MQDERELFDVASKFLPGDSFPVNGVPSFVLITGGPSSGKTTVRMRDYSKGYVILDAADILETLRAPGSSFEDLEKALDVIGFMVAIRATEERRNLVTEMVGDSYEDTLEVMNAMSSLGYEVTSVFVDCDPVEAARRQAIRTDDRMSSLDSQQYHCRWILGAKLG